MQRREYYKTNRAQWEYIIVTSVWLYVQDFRSLGAFAKLQKATVNIIMFVRLSACMEQLGSHWTDFRDFFYLRIFRKICREISSLIKFWRE